jgi:hypothetical protein
MTLGYYGGTVQSPSDYFMFHYQFGIAENMAPVGQKYIFFNSTEGVLSSRICA